MQKFIFILLFSTLSLTSFAQKKPITHDIFDSWKSLSQIQISNNGKYAVCVAKAQDGDGFMKVTNLKTNEGIEIPRATQAQISNDSKFVIFKIEAHSAAKKEAKRKKDKKDEMPKDSIGILTFSTNKIEKIADVKSYKMPKKDIQYFAYTCENPNDTIKNKDKKHIKGDMLIVRSLQKNTEDTIKHIKSFNIPQKGNYLTYTQKPEAKDSINIAGVYLYNVEKGESKALIQGKGEYKLPVFDENGSQIVFYASKDTSKNEFKVFDLYYSSLKHNFDAQKIVDTVSQQMPLNWSVNSFATLNFSKNGEKLYFGISPIVPPKDTTINMDEMANLDIWHYNDDYLQPWQLNNLDKELKRSYLSVIEANDFNKFVQLANTDIEDIYTCDYGNSDIAMATNTKGYRKESQWEGFSKRDVYITSTKTGEKKLIAKALEYYPQLSPKGNYVYWFDKTEAKWCVYSVADQQTRCLNANIDINFYNEKHSMPGEPSSYGHAGWNEDESYIFIYDAYDVWQFSPTMAKEPTNITKGIGRKNKITFRIINTDKEINYIPTNKTILLSAFDNITKESGFYSLNYKKTKEQPKCLLMEKYAHNRVSSLVKAKDNNNILYTKESFNTGRDVWYTSDFWKSTKQITEINPQMSNYLWGTAELVKWKSKDNFDLEGILYKPENFDENKKYPMIVYFYEEHSDELYYHFSPAPSASTINIAEYCSNGYLVFTPDIHYTDGHPGLSAYNSIVAGTEMLCQYPWVDNKKIAIQGQSWGGYQVAHLITKTNMFAAAAAGAPVSNMTSAYGGIRWSSGVTRQMQYEKQQSRIGKDLWDGFDLYIENSPLFFAPKIETPLLLMHNDKDGAVPWYQSIEFFTALRRLNKQVWFLQYNNESHNLKERKNRKDLSIRLKQFFDYYLKGEAMPVWMKYGVPATEKGKTWGYELTEK